MFIPEDVFENTSDELSAVIAGVLDDYAVAQPATHASVPPANDLNNSLRSITA